MKQLVAPLVCAALLAVVLLAAPAGGGGAHAFPWLAAPVIDAPVLAIVPADEVERASAPQTTVVYGDWEGRTSVIGRPVTLRELRRDRRGWVSEQLVVTSDAPPADAAMTSELVGRDGSVQHLSLRISRHPAALPLLLAALSTVTLLAILRSRVPRWAVALGSLCALRIALLGAHLLVQGDHVVYTHDESGYFQTTAAVLAGRWPDHNHYPLGLGLLYVPLAWLLGANDVQALLASQSVASAALLGCLVVAALYGLTRTLLAGCSRTTMESTAVVAGIAAAAQPFFSLVLRRGTPGESACHATSTWTQLPFLGNDLALWRADDLAGYSALSDFPAAALTLVVLLLLARGFAGRTLGHALLLGLLVGSIYLLRTAGVLLLAPTAIALLLSRAERRLQHAGAFMVGVGAVWSLQLITNWIEFGSPWILPYVRHARAASGFELHGFVHGAELYVRAHHTLLCLCLPGLLLLGRSRAGIPTAALFVLHFLFYCGYVEARNNVVRFLLPCLLLAPLLLSLPVVELMGRNWRMRALALLFLASLLLRLPALEPLALELLTGREAIALRVTPVPTWVSGAHALATLGLALSCLRDRARMPALLVGGAVMLAHLASWQGVLAALGCVTAVGVIELFRHAGERDADPRLPDLVPE